MDGGGAENVTPPPANAGFRGDSGVRRSYEGEVEKMRQVGRVVEGIGREVRSQGGGIR